MSLNLGTKKEKNKKRDKALRQKGRNDSKQSTKNQASEPPQNGKASEIEGASMKNKTREKH